MCQHRWDMSVPHKGSTLKKKCPSDVHRQFCGNHTHEHVPQSMQLHCSPEEYQYVVENQSQEQQEEQEEQPSHHSDAQKDDG